MTGLLIYIYTFNSQCQVDLSGTMNWYRNDNSRAYEFAMTRDDGKVVLLSDKPIGFGFATLQ